MQVYTHPVHCKLRSILKLLFTIQGVNIHRHISMYTHVQVDNVVWMSTRDMFRRWTMFSIFFSEPWLQIGQPNKFPKNWRGRWMVVYLKLCMYTVFNHCMCDHICIDSGSVDRCQSGLPEVIFATAGEGAVIVEAATTAIAKVVDGGFPCRK